MKPALNKEGRKNSWIIDILIQLGLVLAAALLFAGSFPNPLIENGIPILAFFAYIPILLIIRKSNLLSCIGWGAIYGIAAYGLFNYWLGAFHPIAGVVVYSIYLVYLAVVFLFLKLAIILFPNKGYIVQWLIWLAYEYLRTLGFLGYTYGITGYSQWQVIPLIQIAQITGVWGVSAIVTFPSFWLAEALSLSENLSHKGTKAQREEEEKNDKFSYKNSVPLCLRARITGIKFFFRKEKISAIVWGAALAGALVFGFAVNKDFSAYPTANIALIQHNIDPWEASRAEIPRLVYEAHRRDLAILTRLSDEALASYPKPQLVVWPETAFVPSIHWHLIHRGDQARWFLVRDLLNYLSMQEVPFLIGNTYARMNPARNPNPNERFRVNYNAALFFERGEITEIFRKIHLVPFTEHFPFERQFPRIHNALLNADTRFWEQGDEFTVFDGPGFRFSVPICFEDTFGYISREFVRQGADVLVNITNDAWANSLSSQNQHLIKAVFRAVENRRSLVRSAVSGQTCAIDPSGRVIALAPPFTETYLNVTIPLVKGTTFYTKYGDYLAIIFTFAAFLLLIYGAVLYTMKKKRGEE